jgi:hypothetical protein
LVSLVLVAVLLPGCVPVTEPLSDPDKAEQDKGLLGKWHRVNFTCDETYEIESPAVKGNPKGLMRAMFHGRAEDPKNTFWFFTTTIGKHTYATIYVEPCDKWEDLRYADFLKEGAFKKWNKGKNRRYFIVRYVLDGDKLTVDVGDPVAVDKLMVAERRINVSPGGGGGIGLWGHTTLNLYATPPGWLAKYLNKSGPETIYNGMEESEQEYRRLMK